MSTVSGLDIANNVEREWRDRLDAAVKAEREKVAAWMIEKGYATGHGDTTESLLQSLEDEIIDDAKLAVAREREACAATAAWVLKMPVNDVSAAIRARGTP